MHRLLLFTSQDIGPDVVAGLHARGDLDLHVVTLRTRRDEIYGYRSTADVCLRLALPVWTPRTFDDAFLSAVEALAPDLIACAFYPRVFPPRLLQVPRLGCVNVHPGLLPDYRGTFPTPWYILNNQREFGITLHYMDTQIDTGDILVQRMFPIGDEETGHELYRRAMGLCGDVLLENFGDILAGRLPRRPQPPGGSYYNRIDRRFMIDWHELRARVRNQVRVHAKPYFPAYSFLFNKCLLINRVSLWDAPGYRAQSPGVIQAVRPDGKFVVSCIDGCLLVEDFDVVPQPTPEELRMHIAPGHRFS